MISMRMMKMAVHQVAGVVAVGNRLVTAFLAVPVRRIVPATGVRGSTAGWIGLADLQTVLIHMIAVLGMQVAVVQIINMVLMLDREVAASIAVHVTMRLMNRAASGLHHLLWYRFHNRPRIAARERRCASTGWIVPRRCRSSSAN